MNIGGHNCKSLDECQLVCPHGRVTSVSGCELCECFEPCESFQCSPNEYCVVENSIAICKSSTFEFICHLRIYFSFKKYKFEEKNEGFCPDSELVGNKSCTSSCIDDSGCLTHEKCCSNQCGSFHCVLTTFGKSKVFILI